MPTKEQLEQENAELRERNQSLADEVRRLRADAEHSTGGERTRKPPQPASFGISEGVRTDLELRKETTDPYTGDKVTREDAEKAGLTGSWAEDREDEARVGDSEEGSVAAAWPGMQGTDAEADPADRTRTDQGTQ